MCPIGLGLVQAARKSIVMSSKISKLTEELRSETKMATPKNILDATQKWSAKLKPPQRTLAGKLAKEIKAKGFTTEMFKPFQSLGLDSFTMEAFLKIAQMSDATLERVKKQTVEMLEVGAAG